MPVKKIQVAMLGPSLEQHGGMATVEKSILSQINCDSNGDFFEVSHITTHEEGSLLLRLFLFSKAVYTFGLKLCLGRVDVVHLHVSERGSVVRKSVLAMLAWVFRKPVIMHTHGCHFQVFFEEISPFMQGLIAKFFQKCTYIIVLSESWKEYYIQSCQLDPNQVIVFPNPVSFPLQLPTRSQSSSQIPSTVRLVFVGRVGERKGAFDAIQAFANLPASIAQKAELLLAGDGEIIKATSLVKKLNLEHQVRLLGWLGSEQRDQLLQSADIFVLPSYNEGLPVAMLEAMAWGLPVLVTQVGGIPDLIQHQQNGFLLPPGDIRQLTHAMQVLILNQSLRITMGDRARKTVLPLDVSHYAKKIFQLYLDSYQQQETARQTPGMTKQNWIKLITSQSGIREQSFSSEPKFKTLASDSTNDSSKLGIDTSEDLHSSQAPHLKTKRIT